MKIPTGLLGFDGRVVKGEICLKSGNNTKLLEQGMKRDGNRFTCYALTSEDDTIMPCLVLNSGVVEFVDVIIDGILRASHSNDKPTAQFSKNFDSFIGQVKEGNKYVNKSYQLQVAKRNTEKARNVKSKKPSAVGSIEIQIFRQDPNAHKAHSKDSNLDSDSDSLSSEGTPDLEDAQRAPTFEDFAEWWHLNPCVDEDATPPPPFEITGVNHKKLTNNIYKNRILKKWPCDYKIWASFKFLLFSTQDFKTLGFLDTPDYNGASWKGAKSTSTKPAVKDVPRALKATSATDGNTDDEDDVEMLVPEPENDFEDPVKTPKVKKACKKTSKSSASEGIELSSSLANLIGSAGKANSSIEDSYPSGVCDEDSDAEVMTTMSKPVKFSDSPQIAVSIDQKASEPADTVIPLPNVEVEKVEFASDDFDQDNKIGKTPQKQKPMHMPGIEGAPASKAWKDPTRSEWNQRSFLGSGSDNLPTLTSDQLHTEQDPNFSQKAHLLFSDNSGDMRHSSAPCVLGDNIEKDKVARFKSLDIEASGSFWEPMTPPASSKKQGSKEFNNVGNEQRVLLAEFNGASRMESAARAIVIEDNYTDNSSREASPTINYRKRLADKKAEKAKKRGLGLSFESQAPHTNESVPSSNVDLMETNFDEFINTSPQPEDTEMVDTVECEIVQNVRSIPPDANPGSSSEKQGQDPGIINLVSPSQSQDLITSHQGEAGSQTPTEAVSQTTLQQIANIQENNMAKRYPSSASPRDQAEEPTGSSQIEAEPDIEMTGFDNNGIPMEVRTSNSDKNNTPADMVNQQDGRQDSPSMTDDDSTISVAPIKPAKQQNTRASAAAKSSCASASKPESTPVLKAPTLQKTSGAKVNNSPQKTPSKVRSSSTVSAQQAKGKKQVFNVEMPLTVTDEAEKSHAKPKKPAPKTAKASNAVAAAPSIVEEPAPKPKGKGRAKAGAGDKRKADQMSSTGNSSGSNKTNASPALKQTSIAERETAAAEARMQAAAEKKKSLEERLQAVRDIKLQMEKANEINRQAQALEEENAALEAEIAQIAAQYDEE